ncbi:hypothetical protein WS75_00790 [Burkholderia sp. FL-7-2-10-S1-D7]|uniref:hypothetical protein n=1 Tax=Burkholderia sp. FL-7-2-10-S1-D7 TaxID=1637866 RepID=UPI0007527C75|nr:hypothetical protein [Burkholderia sp. FL-7-2-10-S1-D7]KVF78281.1 hypothetical protein WS75_00790 [Burkholderia sp. FL-7-2-10-S1-D7]
MAATERITMTMRELDRFKLIQDVADGKLKPRRAGERLELTKLAEVDEGAIIEHKRLSHALQVVEAIEPQRDNRRISGAPSQQRCIGGT